MVGLTLASSEGIVERLPSFRLIKSTCGWGLLLRGGRTRRLRRRLLVNLRSRWSLANMVYFWCRPLEQLSRAV